LLFVCAFLGLSLVSISTGVNAIQSPCSYCTYCDFCHHCDACPCTDKANCNMCKYCKYCSLCKLCSTVCADEGIIAQFRDTLSGAASSVANLFSNYGVTSAPDLTEVDESSLTSELDSLQNIDKYRKSKEHEKQELKPKKKKKKKSTDQAPKTEL